MTDKLKVFAGNSNPELSLRICESLGVEPAGIEVIRFSNENLKVKICENVRGCDVFFIQTSCAPVSEHLMELLIALDALKFASAGRITAVLPYYPYSLADSKDEPRISVAGRLMADLLTEAGADRILTMTLHSPQIMGFCRIPIDQLSGVQSICDNFRGSAIENAVAVAPDISRAKVTEEYARHLGLPLVVLDHRRTPDGESHVHGAIGDVDGKDAILFDDEIVTGDSIIDGSRALKERGAKTIYAGCVHGSLVESGLTRIQDSVLSGLTVTDTIPQAGQDAQSKLTVCSVADHFGDAIKAIHEETSISALFN